MKATIMESKELITEYLRDLSGKPKTEELLDRYISDAALKEHIREFESAFPEYTLEAQEMVSEGDLVAVRGTIHGMHKGVYAGIPPTGRQLNLDRDAFLSHQRWPDFQVLAANRFQGTDRPADTLSGCRRITGQTLS